MFAKIAVLLFVFVIVAAASDTQEDLCIVVGGDSSVSCDVSSQVYLESDVLPLETFDRSTRSHRFYYQTIEDALEYCPFSPVIIELKGNHRVENISRLVYAKNEDLTIRARTNESVIVYNFAALQILTKGINVRFQGWTADGCGETTYGMFLSVLTYQSYTRSTQTFKEKQLTKNCLEEAELAVYNMTILNYRGRFTLCQIQSGITIVNSVFMHVANALSSSKTKSCNISDNVFCGCGIENDQCLYVEGLDIAQAQPILKNNRLCE